MEYSREKSGAGVKFLCSLCLLLLMAASAVAQVVQPQMEAEPLREDFSRQELEQFVDVYVEVVEIQKQNEAEMMQAIEAENLELKRFNEILQAQQQRQTSQINTTPQELASFNNAAQKIIAVQQEAQQQIQQLIEQDLGMDVYQQIVLAYQQSPEVQERVNVLLQEKME